MEPVPCVHCGSVFTPRNKKQYYCLEAPCQRARKAAWQKLKIKTDPDYQTAQKMSWNKWAQNNPDYWKNYRQQNPKKVERNRMLQTIRNRRGKNLNQSDTVSIAKMDARNSNDFEPVGRFWLVPLIAKMDARKVQIILITDSWQ